MSTKGYPGTYLDLLPEIDYHKDTSHYQTSTMAINSDFGISLNPSSVATKTTTFFIFHWNDNTLIDLNVFQDLRSLKKVFHRHGIVKFASPRMKKLLIKYRKILQEILENI